MKKELYKILLLGVWLLNSSNAIADLSVTTKSWPKQLPESEYGPHNYYGSGQAGSFHKAIRSNSPITSSEQASIDAILPARDTERWYVKLGFYNSTTKINSVKNKSTAVNFNNASLHEAKSSKDITGIQIGGGYLFNRYRVDVDYMFGNTARYNQTPLFTVGNPDLTSKITGHHFIANAYYELQNLYLFKPFIGLSAGIGINKVNATFNNTGIAGSNGVEKSKSTLGIDYGLQLGARMRIAKTRFQVSASYRYLSLGKAKWTDNSGTLLLEGKRSFNGFCLDLIYLL